MLGFKSWTHFLLFDFRASYLNFLNLSVFHLKDEDDNIYFMGQCEN